MTLKLRSSAWQCLVRAPTEMKSAPVLASEGIFSLEMPPDISILQVFFYCVIHDTLINTAHACLIEFNTVRNLPHCSRIVAGELCALVSQCSAQFGDP